MVFRKYAGCDCSFLVWYKTNITELLSKKNEAIKYISIWMYADMTKKLVHNIKCIKLTPTKNLLPTTVFGMSCLSIGFFKAFLKTTNSNINVNTPVTSVGINITLK